MKDDMRRLILILMFIPVIFFGQEKQQAEEQAGRQAARADILGQRAFVREYAASKGIGDVGVAIEQGMSDKSAEFLEQGTEIYRKV